MSAYTEIPKIIAETGELPPKVLRDLNERYAARSGTITMWVHPEGSDTQGEGTEDSPYGTINHAVQIAENLALDRSSSVTIRLYAETYAERIRFTRSTGFNLNVIIRGANVGGHPNTPVTVFDGDFTTTGAVYGANQALTLTLEDLKFIKYDTIPVSGVRVNLFTHNVHYQDSAGGVRTTNGAIDVKGGIFENVGYMSNGALGYAGITSFMTNRHSIGQQHGHTDNGPFFYGGYRGVLVQECATGHVDYCTFEDLDIAITSTRSSSVNPDGSTFKRNSIDLRAINASSIVVGDRVTFGSGPDSSNQQMFADATSTISTSMHWSGLASGNAIAERLQSESTTTQALTDDNNTLFNYTITPHFFNDLRESSLYPAKALIGRIIGEVTDPAGIKRFLFTLGGSTVLTNLPSGFSGAFTVEVEAIFRDRQNQILRITLLAHEQQAQVRTTQATVDVSTSPNLSLNMRRLNSQGEMLVHSVQTWLRGI